MKVLDRLRPLKSFEINAPYPSVSRGLFSFPWGNEEDIPTDFHRYIEEGYLTSGIVFACIAARSAVFSQAKFLWRSFDNGQPSEMFYTPELELLDRPWTNAATGDLLSRMEQDVSLAGNFYATVVNDEHGRRLRRLDPMYVTLVIGSKSGEASALDSHVVSYVYDPPNGETVILDPKTVVHYLEASDPRAQFRGMSWLTPVLREVQADKAATVHKLNFFRNGATPSMAITYDKSLTPDQFEEFVEKFRESHEGAHNAYKALHLGGGADVTAFGGDFKALDFKNVVGLSEGRVAAASGVHPSIVPFAEGMQGSALNSGNFNAARRLFVDKTIRSLWSKAAPALESVLAVPDGAHLWVDDRDIAFLRQDAQEEADIRARDAATIASLVTAGYTPDSSVDAVTTSDFRRLEHTNLFSVQLQPPGVPSDEGSST
jgi:phage portal protein BeeE